MGCGTSSPVASGGAATTSSSLSSSSAALTVLVIGLDNSGKTTLAATINGEADPLVVPTVGFNTPTRRRVKGQAVTFFDLGGGARIRGIWPEYFADVHGVVFVVDAADSARFAEARAELRAALTHPMVVGKPLLVLANKADLAAARGAAEVAEALDLEAAAVLCRHTLALCTAKPAAAGAGAAGTAARQGSASASATAGAIAAGAGASAAGAGATVASASGATAVATSAAHGLPLLDARIGLGLEWLVEAVRTDWAGLEERRRREQAEYKRKEAEAKKERLRRIHEEAAAAEEAKKRKAEAAATTAAAAASSSAASPSSTAAAAAPQDEGPKCTVCSAAPAVRRSPAAGWQAVCEPCGSRLEGAAAAAPPAAEETVAAAASAAEAAASPVGSPVTIVSEPAATSDTGMAAQHGGAGSPSRLPAHPHALAATPSGGAAAAAAHAAEAETPLHPRLPNSVPVSPSGAVSIDLAEPPAPAHEAPAIGVLQPALDAQERKAPEQRNAPEPEPAAEPAAHDELDVTAPPPPPPAATPAQPQAESAGAPEPASRPAEAVADVSLVTPAVGLAAAFDAVAAEEVPAGESVAVDEFVAASAAGADDSVAVAAPGSPTAAPVEG